MMTGEWIFAVCWVLIFVVLGIVLLMGKGDNLIAGYNTATPEERKKVDIVRLRIVMACICGLSGALVPMLACLDTSYMPAVVLGFLVAVIGCCIVVHTWATKK